MNLRELTKDNHAAAEDTKFMKAVFAKTLPMTVWEDYTYQKMIWYRAIEEQAKMSGLLLELSGIERADLILADYNEMIGDRPVYHTPRDISKDYAIYIRNLTDPKKILAHLYTWHMGDMHGGQMIKKIIIAPHRHLEFENRSSIIAALRVMLTDDLADEANIAFDWAINILKEYDSSLG